MPKLVFKDWFQIEGFANFGFDQDNKQNLQKFDPDDKPTTRLRTGEILAELYRLPALHGRKATQRFNDTLEWGGEVVGSLRVDVSPQGSWKIVTHRLSTTLDGQPAWICKYVKSLIEVANTHNEKPLAHELYEHLERIDQEMIDAPAKEYQGFERLAYTLANAARRTHPRIMLYHGLKKKADNHYMLNFEYRGQGVEAPGSRRAEQFTIDLNHSPRTGLIRAWGYEISSKTHQHEWQPQPSEWDELFAPSQPQKEIVEAVIALLMTY